MKVNCPVCHVQGILQQRGKSSRIQHYIGFQNGKRIYQYHKMEVNGSNGSKLLEVKKPIHVIFNDFVEPPTGFEPVTFSLQG
jgi:hypothetical protein